MLLITGANGNLGRLIVEEVLQRAPDTPLAVSVRDAGAADDLAERGVEVRQADYHDLASVRAAFTDVDRLLLMPTPAPDPKRGWLRCCPSSKSRPEVGVKHIVYPGAAEVDGLGQSELSTRSRGASQYRGGKAPHATGRPRAEGDPDRTA